MTKKQMAVYYNYLNSSDVRLSDVYGSYSYAKERAYEYCTALMVKKGGYGFRITSYNTFMFTACFQFEENGNTYLMYITPSKDEQIKL
jgi:hypothetical protein